jgi:hypothetical protein
VAGATSTRAPTPTVDLDVAYGLSSTWTGTNSMTVVGVTGLTGDDFVDPGAAAAA